MIGIENKYGSRTYKADEVVWFRKTKEAFGGLSNMCAGYPLRVNGHAIRSSEALYQACRFPDLPEVQRLIINERSPMTAKMKSKPHRTHTRSDWDNVRVPIMRWSLKVKLAQNFVKFGHLLESTSAKQIVEDSRKDRFWGAVREKENNNALIGVNALGRLLMKIRQEYMSMDKYNLLYVAPLPIPNFKLFGEDIRAIDERINFVNALIKDWHIDKYFTVQQRDENKLNGEIPQKKIIKTTAVQMVTDSFLDMHKVKETSRLEIKATPEKVKHFLNNSLNPKEVRAIEKKPNNTVSPSLLFDVPAIEKVIKPEITKSQEDENLKDKIIIVLKLGKTLSSKEIINRVGINWKTVQMTFFLKKMYEVEVIKGKPLRFKLRKLIQDNKQLKPLNTLFDLHSRVEKL